MRSGKSAIKRFSLLPLTVTYLLALTYAAVLAGTESDGRSPSMALGRSGETGALANRGNRARLHYVDTQDSPHARKGKKGLIAEPRQIESPPPEMAERPRTTSQRVSAERISNRRTPTPPRAAAQRIASNKPVLLPKKSSPGPRVVSPLPVEEPPPPVFSTTPVLAEVDRIEVIEWGSTRSTSQTSGSSTSGRTSGGQGRPVVSNRRIEVEIDAPRVLQIQQALIGRGFLTGEPTGIYDDLTIDAMRQFQMSQKIDTTGYPTAHALKRLGL
ncbi:MAG: peptidoglycan-binding domain-containing protein [Acidobacteriota bacterium]